MSIRNRLAAALLLICSAAHADGISGGIGVAGGVGTDGLSSGIGGGSGTGGGTTWTLPGATYDFDFANNRAYVQGAPTTPAAALSVTRASVGTDLLPVSASGASFQNFISGQIRLTPGLGLLVEESRTNFLLNSTAPATQTTASLGTGTYTLWVNGSGSATMSAGTGTGCGTSTATQGSQIQFTITVAGTCTVTKTGTLNEFQLELGSFGTSFIPTAGATVTRAADQIVYNSATGLGSAMSIYATGIPYVPGAASTNQIIAGLDDGTANNRFVLYRHLTNPSAVMVISGSTIFNTISALVWTSAVSGKMTGFATGGTQASLFNGSSVATGSNGAIPVVANIYIGEQSSATGFWNGYISRLAVGSKSLLNL